MNLPSFQNLSIVIPPQVPCPDWLSEAPELTEIVEPSNRFIRLKDIVFKALMTYTSCGLAIEVIKVSSGLTLPLPLDYAIQSAVIYPLALLMGTYFIAKCLSRLLKHYRLFQQHKVVKEPTVNLIVDELKKNPYYLQVLKRVNEINIEFINNLDWYAKCDTSSNTIHIHSGINPKGVPAAIIFESCNMLQKNRVEELNKRAREGNISREEYVSYLTHIEHSTFMMASKIELYGVKKLGWFTYGNIGWGTEPCLPITEEDFWTSVNQNHLQDVWPTHADGDRQRWDELFAWKYFGKHPDELLPYIEFIQKEDAGKSFDKQMQLKMIISACKEYVNNEDLDALCFLNQWVKLKGKFNAKEHPLLFFTFAMLLQQNKSDPTKESRTKTLYQNLMIGPAEYAVAES